MPAHGLGVAETAQRLAALHAAVRASLPETARRMLEEPRLETRAALASHLYDDARSAAKLERRAAELGAAPAEPAPDVTAAAEALHADVEPLADEATLRVVTQLLLRRRRHADELDPRIHQGREIVSEVDLPAASAAHVQTAERAARALAGAEAIDAQLDLARVAAGAMRHALLLERLPVEAAAALEHVEAEAAIHAELLARHGA